MEEEEEAIMSRGGGRRSDYTFNPTDEFLITDYLKKKEMGLSLPCNGTVVIVRDLYGDAEDKAPWLVFTSQDPWQRTITSSKSKEKHLKTIYVLTPLKKRSLNRCARTAGCGTWHSETGCTKIKDDQGNLIGVRKMLTFEVTDLRNTPITTLTSEGHWIMHEFTCQPPGMYALCKITRDGSKKLKIAPKIRMVKGNAASVDDDEDGPPRKKMHYGVVAALVPDIEVDDPSNALLLPVPILPQPTSFGIESHIEENADLSISRAIEEVERILGFDSFAEDYTDPTLSTLVEEYKQLL